MLVSAKAVVRFPLPPALPEVSASVTCVVADCIVRFTSSLGRGCASAIDASAIGSSALPSKLSWYSISYGFDIAVVSASTGIAVLSADTGIVIAECPAVSVKAS